MPKKTHLHTFLATYKHNSHHYLHICIVNTHSIHLIDTFSDRLAHTHRDLLSLLFVFRPQDNSAEGFNDWAFMTTHSWDEDPRGEWTLEIENVAGLNDYGTAISFIIISIFCLVFFTSNIL